ncbi:MAG: amidohydrolase family protein [Betaproteobacteria bacterium]
MAHTPRIDVHSHVFSREMLDLIRAQPHDFGMHFADTPAGERLLRDDGHVSPLFDEFFDADAKVAGMERKGLDISVISPTPMIYFYNLDADRAARATRMINDGVANMVATHPDRLRGMATLPMQNADAAVAELERVVTDHGFRAIELGCTIVGDQLAEKRYRPVLKRAQELRVFIFTHPHFTDERCGLESYYLSNLVGFPLDTVTMAAHLMFSGALDELPDLRIVLAHGGGYLPYQIGRLAHGYAVRKEPHVNRASSPRDLLRRFYFDALTHDDKALAFLIEQVGADRVMLGTDAPFDMGEERPLARLDCLNVLSAVDRERIEGLNAAGLLNERPE